jgi:hypothetical protein
VEAVNLTPTAFLKNYGIDIKGEPQKFNVEVPQNWEVKAGDYPIGLYWKLANEFSKEEGLDLTSLKGKTVEVNRYAVEGGLPGQGDQSSYNYESNAIVLVKDKKIVGAWLAFNTTGIGPSLKKHYLTDITGLSYEDWLKREGIFTDMGKNNDLMNMEPVDMLKAFFKAINDGNKARAYACLDPTVLQDSLTMNYHGEGLNNSGFNGDNSLVENIISPKPISFEIHDPKDMANILTDIGNRTEIEIAVDMEIKWRDATFNSATGREIRFAVLKKYSTGWKLCGLGTGP